MRTAQLRALTPSRFRPGASGLRLTTLIRLRWVAILGQAGAVLFVHYVLGYPLPVGLSLGVIALSVCLNIALRLTWRANLRLRNRYAALLLGYDIVQLAALLYLTGGLENPFSFLFMVPVTISASTLRRRHTIFLGAITLASISLLAFFHQPLPWDPDAPLVIPHYYVLGVWTALVCGLGFMSAYAWRIAQETRRMTQALSAADVVYAQKQRLSALDGLAAAAAHELGTPLATIALVTKELRRALDPDSPHGEDLALLASQSARCRDILAKLTDVSDVHDAMFDEVRLSVLLEEAIAPHRRGDIEIVIHLPTPEDGAAGGEPVMFRTAAVLQGLGNLIENATQFAATTVDVIVLWTPKALKLTISDDGPGFAVDILENLGEPYVTSRRRRGRAAGTGEPASGAGLGLGFFIARNLLERSGAKLKLANKALPDHGAVVQLRWLREAIERQPGTR